MTGPVYAYLTPTPAWSTHDVHAHYRCPQCNGEHTVTLASKPTDLNAEYLTGCPRSPWSDDFAYRLIDLEAITPTPPPAPRETVAPPPPPRPRPAPPRAPSPATTPARPAAHVLALDVAPDGVVLLIVGCPRCASSHRHGGGNTLDADFVRGYLGHREAHCANPSDRGVGYDVVDTYGVIQPEVARLTHRIR